MKVCWGGYTVRPPCLGTTDYYACRRHTSAYVSKVVQSCLPGMQVAVVELVCLLHFPALGHLAKDKWYPCHHLDRRVGCCRKDTTVSQLTDPWEKQWREGSVDLVTNTKYRQFQVTSNVRIPWPYRVRRDAVRYTYRRRLDITLYY